ncbi:MAG: ATP synthase F1 subunit gamma [Candidatus Wildermuthbacteria bacterium]|nr:ATP synthase F1 subunit gamma [Candidatus Wildermuthbacteria bacterium]
MASKLQIKGKISATKNIRQITKAMQMVAASKMRKAQEAALRARPYARRGLIVLRNILAYLKGKRFESALTRERERRRVCLVVVTSDRGLCGSFNSGVLRSAAKFCREHKDKTIEIVSVGKKAKEFFKNGQCVQAAEFGTIAETLNRYEAEALAEWILRSYEEERYDAVYACATSFVSVLSQKPDAYQILPLSVEELERVVRAIVPKTGRYSEIAKDEESFVVSKYYEFEPTAEELVSYAVRQMLKAEVLHLLLESAASEHSARMVAMKNASESADKVLEDLQRVMNRVRQAGITQELSEITTAKEALMAE